MIDFPRFSLLLSLQGPKVQPHLQNIVNASTSLSQLLPSLVRSSHWWRLWKHVCKVKQWKSLLVYLFGFLVAPVSRLSDKLCTSGGMLRKVNVSYSSRMFSCIWKQEGPVAQRLVSANRWLRGIKMYRFPWYLTLVSTNHASSNPGQLFVQTTLIFLRRNTQ